MKYYLLMTAVIIAFFVLTDNERHDYPRGENGGILLEIADKNAVIEAKQDEAAGSMTIHVLQADTKTPLKISSNIIFETLINNKKLSLELKAEKLPAAKFTLYNDIFKLHINGDAIIRLDDMETPMRIPIPHVH